MHYHTTLHLHHSPGIKRHKPDKKAEKSEERIALNSKDLSEYYKLKEGKTMTDSSIRKTYLLEFLQNGLVDEAISAIDARCKIYYPLVEFPSISEDKEKYEYYRNKSHSHNLFQCCRLKPSKNYINIDKEWLKFTILDYDDNNDNEGKICICRFEKKYEETKYGPLILLFSNAKNCNSYNKIFSGLEYNGTSFKEKEEKLREWPKFSQYSYFDRKEEESSIEKQESVNNTNTVEITDTNSNFLSNIDDSSKDKNDIDSGDTKNNNETSVSASILDTSKTTSKDLNISLDIDNDTLYNNESYERLIEVLKPHPLIGYREPFYYCKDHPNVENMNDSDILFHLMYYRDHRSK